MATTFCTKSCPPPGHSICTTRADCAGGGACTPLQEGANSSVLAAAFEFFFACIPPDGGVVP